METRRQTVQAISQPGRPGQAPAFPAAVWRTAALLTAHAALLLWLTAGQAVVIYNVSDSYPALHTAMEVISVAAACMIFAVGWYGLNRTAENGITVLSAAFLAVALLDLGHLLSFPGMPVFVTPSSVAKGIDFWLAARCVSVMALLAAALLPWRESEGWPTRYVVLAGSLAFTALIYWLVLYRLDLIPATYAAGIGLTRAKLWAEYGLIAAFLCAAVLFLERVVRKPAHRALDLLAASSIMAMSEICFTLYVEATDAFNFAGHAYKVTAYLFLFRAIFISGVREPYRRLRCSEQSLAKSESKFRSLMEFAPDAILLIDHAGRVVMLNAKAQDMFGIEREAAIGHQADSLVPVRSDQSVRYEAVCRNGREGAFAAEISLGRLQGRADGSTIAIVRDISERHKAAAEKERLLAVLEVTPDLISIIDNQRRTLYLNRAGRQLIGMPHSGVVHDVVGEDYLAQWTADLIREQGFPVAQRDGHWTGEGALRRSNGEETAVSIALLCHKDANGNPEYWSIMCRDISERKHFERMMFDQLTHDALTGLPNRLLVVERLREAIIHARMSNTMLAVFFLDVDYFKKINDTFGRAYGDEVLREIVNRLGQAMFEGDTLARQGGDEFILLQREIADRQEAVDMAEDLLRRMREPFYIHGHEMRLSASLGISLYPHDERTEEGLLHKAHVAANSAKKEERNCYRFHSPDMEQSIRERLEMETFLRYAVEKNELLLHYQPKVSLTTGDVVGAEALVRWQHPTLGVVSPARFIPIAEESGLINEIGMWVLRSACNQVMAWQAEGLPPVRVSVNISARQFEQTGLAQKLQAILLETGINPAFLELEITESTVMRDTETAIKTLRSLKKLNVALSIDDFGTGYSSLNYLKLFPIDVLKIDRSFITDVIHDPNDAAITRAIVALAHELDLDVIAEGVETPAQTEFLRKCGCDEMQGYYFSKPVPTDVMAGILRDRKKLVIPENVTGLAQFSDVQ